MSGGERRRWSWAQTCARRLERHHLSAPGTGPADVVAAICGSHAQVLSAAELSVGLRLDDATVADVREALWTDRSLVKTFGPRGTIHLLPTRDLPMWTGALSVIPAAAAGLAPDLRLTPDQTDYVVAAVAAALDGAELTIDELSDAVVEATGPWAGDPVMPAFGGMWPRWRQALATAAHRGALCFGPNRGRKATYTSPSRWLPGFRPAEGSGAVVEVLRRYLHAYGPATPGHFARWMGTTPRWATDLFRSRADELEPVELAGAEAWLPVGDADAPSHAPSGVRLLPYFDAYTVGCQPRGLLFEGPVGERALSRTGQAGNFPVLLVDGSVRGVWHQRRTGHRVDITVEPFAGLASARRRALSAEVDEIGRFLGLEPKLTIGTVTVGGHA